MKYVPVWYVYLTVFFSGLFSAIGKIFFDWLDDEAVFYKLGKKIKSIWKKEKKK